MKVSQEDAVLIKNLHLSKGYGARRLLSEFPDRGSKLGCIDRLPKRSYKTGTVVRQSGSGRPRSARSEGGPPAQSRGQAKKEPISSCDFTWNWHSVFKCAQDNSPWSPAEMLQMTSCSAVAWSQLRRPSHSLINNRIVCNKSCHCSFINRKLNNKWI